MIVTAEDLPDVLSVLKKATYIGLDTETTGLRRFHGDRLFSLILAADIYEKRYGYYFNFWKYDGVPKRFVLQKSATLKILQNEIFSNPNKTWFAHNAKFDLHMLDADDCKIAGHVHCTKAIGRVVYNEHNQYDLATSLERIGLSKDGAVERYIEENGLYEMVDLPHKTQREKNKFFYKVPFEIIVPYGIKDAEGTLDLGYHQIEEIGRIDRETKEDLPSIIAVYHNEVDLTKTVQRMEANGCRIDPEYCKEAAAFEKVALDASQEEIESASGIPFKNSAKCLAKIFTGQEHNFSWNPPSPITGKSSLSFDEDALLKIEHPLVDAVLRYRGAKSRLQFYQGFLYHMDDKHIVHPNFNPDTTRHGRFSSSNPNFQNLTRPEDDVLSDEVFYVRRAIIPREGNVLLMPDWRGMEYAMMLEYACRSVGRVVPLAARVNDGMKIHKATVEMCHDMGMDLTIEEAKPANFLTLYEGGPNALAALLKCTKDRAYEIQDALTKACPEMKAVRERIIETARHRGYVFNWLGRRCNFPVSKFAYRAPNYVDSGGCADVMKIVMNRVQDWLGYGKKESLIICTIHDELVLDCPKAEAREVAEHVVHEMENTFPAQYVPLKVDMEWSDKSLADKIKGYPDG